MSIRVIRGCLLLLLLGSWPAQAADLAIVRVYASWRDAASFKRISEYFDGKENTGGEAVLRTHPDQREGYYFLVRIAHPGAPRRITARLQVITTTDAKPRTYTFSPELRASDPVFHLGLTGPDWPDPQTDPVAWKLDLTDADGTVLASEKSYLWEKPAVK